MKIGSKSLELTQSLLSSNSTCYIISAGKPKEQHGIIASNANELLVRIKDNKPIARLETIDHILYMKPLKKEEQSMITKSLAAPGVARIPKVINADRWHQRLGHIGQQILKTAENLYGMEGIDYSDLTTCDTCHLSKAQRFVSREPRPIPGELLDEIFIDTVGKLTESINGYKYLVIITDAKSSMRWTMTTKGKDEIANELVQWSEYQHYQYGKKICIVFRDRGTEFSRIREYCIQNSISTDVSSPYTPEQNGAAEASNKIILTKARSILIDA